jgi:starch synthase
MHELDGEFFDFHDERAIFFCRGVLETVKKLGWAPDVVHCGGWMTALVPLYLKKAFADDPIFSNTKIVYSVFDQVIDGDLSADMSRKAKVQGVEDEDVAIISDPKINNLHKIAIDFADAVISGSENIDPEIEKYIIESGKSSLNYHSNQDCIEAFDALYDELLEEEVVLS